MYGHLFARPVIIFLISRIKRASYTPPGSCHRCSGSIGILYSVQQSGSGERFCRLSLDYMRISERNVHCIICVSPPCPLHICIFPRPGDSSMFLRAIFRDAVFFCFPIRNNVSICKARFQLIKTIAFCRTRVRSRSCK